MVKLKIPVVPLAVAEPIKASGEPPQISTVAPGSAVPEIVAVVSLVGEVRVSDGTLVTPGNGTPQLTIGDRPDSFPLASTAVT
mgnify:CR=1 FL=1